MNSAKQDNVDHSEIAKFSALSSKWWDPDSEFKPLHEINPLRLEWIRTQSGSLKGKKFIDIGCGGGILAESMAKEGALVTGIDLAPKSLTVARLHSLESQLSVEYLNITAEQIADERAATYDVVTCMEMLEHVPDPSAIVSACAQLVKPGGYVFVSTLNRNYKSFLMAIVGAEYILGLVPKGTHYYNKFIKPSELFAYLQTSGLELKAIRGLSYNPLTKIYHLTDDTTVNYMLVAQK